MSPFWPHWTWRKEPLVADWRMYQLPVAGRRTARSTLPRFGRSCETRQRHWSMAARSQNPFSRHRQNLRGPECHPQARTPPKSAPIQALREQTRRNYHFRHNSVARPPDQRVVRHWHWHPRQPIVANRRRCTLCSVGASRSAGPMWGANGTRSLPPFGEALEPLAVLTRPYRTIRSFSP